MSKELLSVRIDSEVKAALERISDQDRDVYAPSKARIVERGIELALRELEAKRARK
jgi:hypothetical protein